MKKTSILTIVIITAGLLFMTYQQALAYPSTPMLRSPSSGSTVSDLTPKLDWDDVSGATIYEYDIGNGSIRSTTTQSEFTVPEGKLDANTSYSWKVRACTNSYLNACSSFTSSWKFSTPKLNAPFLVAPDNNEKLENLTPELKWEEANNAYQYMVRVTNNSGLEIFSQTTRDTSLTMPNGKLKRGNTYKWKVGACGASCSISTSSAGNTTWSTERSFSTQDILAVPELISPIDYITISTPPVILDWEPVSTQGGQGWQGWFSFDTGAYQYSYKKGSGPEVIEETLVSRGTVDNLERGVSYSWKVRYCTDLSVTDCGEWSPTWHFSISKLLEGPMVVSTDNPGKYDKLKLSRNQRNQICPNKGDNDCYKIYDSCFDRYGKRISNCHITIQASFMPTNSYNIYLIDPDTGATYKNLDMVPIGKALKLVIEEPEGEWFMAGGSFDSPPISWVNDAVADYQKTVPVSINPLYEYTINASSITSKAYNILTPGLGVSATDPLASGKISIEEVESMGKFEIYKENGDYFIRAINASGIGIIQVAVPDAFAYGTIDNLWFSSGRIPGAAQIFYFSLTDDQLPIADAKISTDGINYSDGPADAIQGNSTIYLSAEASSDPDGWSGEKGVAAGGYCEWKNSLNQSVFKKDNPLSPLECNTSIVNPTSVGSETYTLTIGDNLGLSGSDSVVANVTAGVNTLKVCLNSCSSGSIPLSIPNYLLISVGEERNLKACYSTILGCNDPNSSADITSSAGWSITSDPDNSINLTGNNPKVIIGMKVGNARLQASNATDTVDFDVRVSSGVPTPVCGDSICNGNENCSSCPQDCGKCPPGYIEVTP